MPTYGIFHNGADEPYRKIEGGDRMSLDREYVSIFKGKAPNSELVAAVRLDAGQSVQEIKLILSELE